MEPVIFNNGARRASDDSLAGMQSIASIALSLCQLETKIVQSFSLQLADVRARIHASRIIEFNLAIWLHESSYSFLKRG